MGYKITWTEIFKDFKNRHPRLAMEVAKWGPHDYLQIIVYMKDGMVLVYDYFDHKAVIFESGAEVTAGGDRPVYGRALNNRYY